MSDAESARVEPPNAVPASADADIAAEPTITFADLGLRAELLAALTTLGYEEPTPIQAAAIPPMLQGRDLLGQAATGTGKTAAFALPLLERLGRVGAERTDDDPMALVLVPTRELAMQVSEAIHRYGRGLHARVLPIFGGQPIGRQLTVLRRGVDVVVATPGRAIDHIDRGSLGLDGIEVVVLDEADEMLDMGFAEDIEAILSATPEGRQTVLFSATMPGRITGLANRHLSDPERIQIADTESADEAAQRVRQVAYVVPRAHKPAALGRILDIETPTAAIVFCRTRTEVDDLAETLNGRGYRAEALHGGMDQQQRDRVMGRVRSGAAELLVATDVAARGLDIEHLTHVVNYDVPSAPDSYVHRIGRVGRAGREGVAITLAEPREHRLLKNIERVTRRKLAIEKVPTLADLRNRRLELTTWAIREALHEGDLDQFRVVVETLTDEHDIVEVALAAVRLVHENSAGGDDEAEIPQVSLKTAPAGRERDRDRRDRDRDRDRGARFEREGRPTRDRADRFERAGASDRDDRRTRDEGRGPRGRHPGDADTTRLYIGVGRDDRVRPGDLVGAIAGETSLSGRDIGAIQIGDHFSLVEVPERAVDEVIAAIKKTTIKGRKPTIRREKFDTRR